MGLGSKSLYEVDRSSLFVKLQMHRDKTKTNSHVVRCRHLHPGCAVRRVSAARESWAKPNKRRSWSKLFFTSTTVELVLTSKIKNRTWTYNQWTCVCRVHNDITDAGKSIIFIRNTWTWSSKSFPSNTMILQSPWLFQLPCLAHSSFPLTRNKACTAKYRVDPVTRELLSFWQA